MIWMNNARVERDIDSPLTINIELLASEDENPTSWIKAFDRLLTNGMPAFRKAKTPPCSHTRDILGRICISTSTIHKIYHNPKKGTTVVLFETGRFNMINGREAYHRIKVKRDPEDIDDIYMAVASAVMIRKYNTNSQFKAHLRRSTPKGVAEIPGIYQVAAAYETSEIYGSWENFCKIVDEKLILSGKK